MRHFHFFPSNLDSICLLYFVYFYWLLALAGTPCEVLHKNVHSLLVLNLSRDIFSSSSLNIVLVIYLMLFFICLMSCFYHEWIRVLLNAFCVHACEVASLMSDSLWPYGLQPTRLLCQWVSPGKSTGVGCCALLQGIFLTSGSNLSIFCLLHHLYC